jgi:3-oxoacyl-[acyl-carrier-protein] synthase III
MSIWGRTAVVGAFEHPTRFAPDKTAFQLHAESARGALEDAGLHVQDVDGFFTSGLLGDAPPVARRDTSTSGPRTSTRR